MSRLIDADALEREGWSLRRTFQKDKDTMVYEVKKPSDFPHIEERKTGKWVKAPGAYCTPGGDPVWCCSECGKGRHVYGVEHGSYGADVADGQWVACPNCGAVMDGESL